jgi:hypothetical protein
MTRETFKQVFWFAGGALCGLAMLSISKASVAPSQVTDDTAIYQNLSEIQVSKDQAPSFDSDISRLSKMEGHYQEKLPGATAKRTVQRTAQRTAQKTAMKSKSIPQPYSYQTPKQSSAQALRQ